MRGEDEKALFTRKYKAFQQLLNGNNTALATMGDMQEKAGGAFIFDIAYVESSYRCLAESVKQIIKNLNLLSDNKHKDLLAVYERVDTAVKETLRQRVAIPKTDYVLHLGSIDKDMVSACGAKMAFLGEVANRIGLPVPCAFVVTTFAYHSFIEHNRIGILLMEKCSTVDIRNYAGLEDASRQMQRLIQEGEIPGDLQEAVLAALEEIKRKTADPSLRVSVRSSAVLEDIMASFAGQYQTLLNVTEANLLDAYKNVLSSQFTPRALFYYKDKGFNVEEMAMAVGVVQMVDAVSSGIIYSRDPSNPKQDTVLVNSVWGLGNYAVEGMVSPETFKVHTKAKDECKYTVLREKHDRQKVMMRPLAGGGTQEVAVSDRLEDKSCLNNDQVLELSDFARKAEAHFKRPQDVEWAQSPSGDIHILQSRPLRVGRMPDKELSEEARHIKGHELLLDGGKIASRGVAAGPVCRIRKIGDVDEFPKGGVLVVRQAHPEYAALLERACAVISDTGSVLGHLATVARERMIPAIFNAKDATKILSDGTAVTVDGIYGRVFEGEVPKLMKLGNQGYDFENSPICERLRTILKEITPLRLTDPRSHDFRPKNCRTFHDIIRFSHEMAIREMFDFGQNTYFSEKSARKLVSKKIPLEWLVIDLEDGLKSGLQGKQATPEDIVSVPMLAIWEGMTAVPWKGPPPMDTKGFLSVLAGSATEPDAVSYLTDKNYIVLSKRFCNLSVRLGFHYSTAEAYLGDNEDQNYVSFVFKGGGADHGRKRLRATFISRILENFDFRVEVKQDAVFARIEGYEQALLKERLKVLGHIIVHTRQMDMVMFNDKMVDWYYRNMMKDISSFLHTPNRDKVGCP